jgi:hypothetical protein
VRQQVALRRPSDAAGDSKLFRHRGDDNVMHCHGAGRARTLSTTNR